MGIAKRGSFGKTWVGVALVGLMSASLGALTYSPAAGAARAPQASGDDCVVAFSSRYSALVPIDDIGGYDVFLRDLCSRTTSLVSVGLNGLSADEESIGGELTADGRFVVFSSWAENLVADDTNDASDVFVRDLQTGVTERVSLAEGGAQANGDSDGAHISSDGRFVVFSSNAPDLVPEDTNGPYNHDVFVRELQTGVTTRVSESTAGAEANGRSWVSGISGDGSFVVFGSEGSNLVAGDTNGNPDIFVRDVNHGVTERVSVSTSGAQANARIEEKAEAAISDDGRLVVFGSDAPNLVTGDTNKAPDVFVRDRALGITKRVSLSTTGAQGNDYSHLGVDISSDGQFVVFSSRASNLVKGDTNGHADVFVRNLRSGVTKRISLSSSGRQANNHSFYPTLSASDRWVVFESKSTNLVKGPVRTWGYGVFARDLQTGATKWVSARLPASAYVAQWGAKKGNPKVGKRVSVAKPALTTYCESVGCTVKYLWKAGSKKVGKKKAYRVARKYKGKKLTVTVRAKYGSDPVASKKYTLGKIR